MEKNDTESYRPAALDLSGFDLTSLRYSSDGLIPAVVVDDNETVLMVAYMNEKSLQLSLSSGRTWFYSRSREEYWAKGETSGNIQIIKEIRTDCDSDTLLIKVHQVGEGACHTGSYSCFFNLVASAGAGNEP